MQKPIVITRSTAQIEAALTPQARLEVQAIAGDMDELRRENPLALLPDSPVRVWLLEPLGLAWDFEAGRWGWADDSTPDRGIAYRYPEQAEGLVLGVSINRTVRIYTALAEIDLEKAQRASSPADGWDL